MVGARDTLQPVSMLSGNVMSPSKQLRSVCNESELAAFNNSVLLKHRFLPSFFQFFDL